jgi:hypothetical protein
MGCNIGKSGCCCDSTIDDGSLLSDGTPPSRVIDEKGHVHDTVFMRLDDGDPQLDGLVGSQSSRGNEVEIKCKSDVQSWKAEAEASARANAEKLKQAECIASIADTHATGQSIDNASLSIPNKTNEEEGTDRNATQVIPEDTDAHVEAPDTSPEPFQDRVYEGLASENLRKHIVSSSPRRPSTVETKLQDYVEKHANDWKQFEAMEPMDGWNLSKQQDGAKVYLKQIGGSRFMSFKAVLELPFGVDRLPYVIGELFQVEKRPQWDKMCQVARTVESYPPFYRVTYVRMASPAVVIAPRDLCILGRLKCLEDGGVMLSMVSVDHADEPIAPGHVRAKMLCGGYIFRPVPGKNALQAMFIGTVDPGGWLPAWVANAVAWKQGLALVLWRDTLK